VEKEENVFPMVPSGESVSNIRLEWKRKDYINLKSQIIKLRSTLYLY
jgi:hypothetical protein